MRPRDYEMQNKKATKRIPRAVIKRSPWSKAGQRHRKLSPD